MAYTKFEIANALACAVPNGASTGEVLKGTVLFLADLIDQTGNDHTTLSATKGLLDCEVAMFKDGKYQHS